MSNPEPESYRDCILCGKSLVTEWEHENGICVDCNNKVNPVNAPSSRPKKEINLSKILSRIFWLGIALAVIAILYESFELQMWVYIVPIGG